MDKKAIKFLADTLCTMAAALPVRPFSQPHDFPVVVVPLRYDSCCFRFRVAAHPACFTARAERLRKMGRSRVYGVTGTDSAHEVAKAQRANATLRRLARA